MYRRSRNGTTTRIRHATIWRIAILRRRVPSTWRSHNSVAIVGLDATPGMLTHARRKAGDLLIQWIEADARTFQLSTSFRLIYGTTGIFQHMLERADQEALLDRVRAHLAPEG